MTIADLENDPNVLWIPWIITIMKKCLTLLFLVISFQVVAQTYPIISINISLPANPDNNTANWGNENSLLTITSTAEAVRGSVPTDVIESKILVTIKKGGSKACGAYTKDTAPRSNFNTLIKVWSGSNAIALLGQDCVLAPGDYEICVQFFGQGAMGMAALSEESRRLFSISEQPAFQPPQPIAPVNGAVISEADAKNPITFTWLPVIPRPQDPVTYRLTVWQLMQGQTGTIAMQVNQPLITKDVDNISQAVINNLATGPCLPPYLCLFIWNVQALNGQGTPIGENNGTSMPFLISVTMSNSYPLSVTKSGTGIGTVNSNPTGISCDTTCSADFSSGTSVTLSATADAGSTFTGWSGACTGRGSCVVAMNSDQSVTATFKRVDLTLILMFLLD